MKIIRFISTVTKRIAQSAPVATIIRRRPPPLSLPPPEPLSPENTDAEHKSVDAQDEQREKTNEEGMEKRDGAAAVDPAVDQDEKRKKEEGERAPNTPGRKRALLIGIQFYRDENGGQVPPSAAPTRRVSGVQPTAQNRGNITQNRPPLQTQIDSQPNEVPTAPSTPVDVRDAYVPATMAIARPSTAVVTTLTATAATSTTAIPAIAVNTTAIAASASATTTTATATTPAPAPLLSSSPTVTSTKSPPATSTSTATPTPTSTNTAKLGPSGSLSSLLPRAKAAKEKLRRRFGGEGSAGGVGEGGVGSAGGATGAGSDPAGKTLMKAKRGAGKREKREKRKGKGKVVVAKILGTIGEREGEGADEGSGCVKGRGGRQKKEGSEGRGRHRKEASAAKAGEENVLRGCHKDVLDVRGMLVDLYGYKKEDVVVLIDDPDPASGRVLPTRENIINSIQKLVEDARAGDSFFFFYAGHSTQRETDSLQEEDGMDELIVTWDNLLIQDDELRVLLVESLPSGCKLTAVFDSCHSASLLDLEHFRCNRVYVPWINKGKRRSFTKWNPVVRRAAAPPHSPLLSFSPCMRLALSRKYLQKLREKEERRRAKEADQEERRKRRKEREREDEEREREREREKEERALGSEERRLEELERELVGSEREGGGVRGVAGLVVGGGVGGMGGGGAASGGGKGMRDTARAGGIGIGAPPSTASPVVVQPRWRQSSIDQILFSATQTPRESLGPVGSGLGAKESVGGVGAKRESAGVAVGGKKESVVGGAVGRRESLGVMVGAVIVGRAAGVVGMPVTANGGHAEVGAETADSNSSGSTTAVGGSSKPSSSRPPRPPTPTKRMRLLPPIQTTSLSESGAPFLAQDMVLSPADQKHKLSASPASSMQPSPASSVHKSRPSSPFKRVWKRTVDRGKEKEKENPGLHHPQHVAHQVYAHHPNQPIHLLHDQAHAPHQDLPRQKRTGASTKTVLSDISQESDDSGVFWFSSSVEEMEDGMGSARGVGGGGGGSGNGNRVGSGGGGGSDSGHGHGDPRGRQMRMSGMGVGRIPRCQSPEAIFCTGWCKMDRDAERTQPFVISLSAAKDGQQAWEDANGASMTQALIKILRADPHPTLGYLLGYISHELHSAYLDLHARARAYKKQARVVNQKRRDMGKEEIATRHVEMDNFQDPQISSLFPLNMKVEVWAP